jgi:hypothetical protein
MKKPVLWIVIVLMTIRIRIGIKTMPIVMRILPQVLHMMENPNIFTFIFWSQHCRFTMFCLSHQRVKCAPIFSIFDTILKFSGKKVKFINFSFDWT